MPYVFDTNIWVAALRSRRGASFVLLQCLNRSLITGAVSEALFLEYVDVLHRETNLQNFWADSGEVDVILAALATHMVPVPIYFTWRPQLTDPNDEMILDCAINARASAIVTFNVQDFLPAAQLFGLEVIRPGELIRRDNLLEQLAG